MHPSSYGTEDLLLWQTDRAIRIGTFSTMQMHRAERVTPPGGSDFYVAVDGNDAGAGSLSDPFRTLRRASEAVSAARSAARGTPQRAVVYLRGGAHFLRDTLALGAEHSNTLWTAYADEKVLSSPCP